MEAPFYHRIEAWLKEGKEIKRRLKRAGPNLLYILLVAHSLREISRRSKLSPTYLSRVRNRTIEISPEAFLKLVKMKSLKETK